ncbi:hypothetical protein CC78DRAFT_608511 [Lojkania enalia]|uniref:Xylanolytic transcriptional activator regulatory domain-containing protein n=1 Tax=Lojkania enalia TaxID=147567 RepID=A0A9P4K3P5_9PLEO|nr:hypothetical protein CC78DRAFT_608511 [Didymosphaeria enalia]
MRLCVYSTTPAHNIDHSVVRKRSLRSEDGQKKAHVSQSPSSIARETSANTPPEITHTKSVASQSKSEVKSSRKPPRQRNPRSAATASLQYLVDTARLILRPDEEPDGVDNPSTEHKRPTKSISVWNSLRHHKRNVFDRTSLPPRKYAQSLLDAFFEGPNRYIYVCERLEMQARLDRLYNEKDAIEDEVKALIYLTLAVGAQWKDGVSSEDSATWSATAQDWMDIAQQDDQENWLWVAQALLLTCLRHAAERPAKCYIDLGSAVKVAQTYRIDLSFEDSCFDSQETYSKWRQVWLSLIFVDAWLSTALGRNPQITCETSQDPFLRNLKLDYGLLGCSVQTCNARMGVIISRMLKDIHSSSRVDIRVYDQYLQVIQKWINGIPPHLRLTGEDDNALNNLQSSITDYYSALHLELTHLGSVMFLLRPLLLHCAGRELQQPDTVLPETVRVHAQACTDSAIRIARCCSSLMSRGILAKRSWYMIHLTFNAAIIILLNMSRSRTVHDASRVTHDQIYQHQQELGFSMCMSILSHCASQDALAAHFFKIAQDLHNSLPSKHATGPMVDITHMHPPINKRPSLNPQQTPPSRSSSSAQSQLSHSTSHSSSTSFSTSTPLSMAAPDPNMPLSSAPNMDGVEFTGPFLYLNPETPFYSGSSSSELLRELGSGMDGMVDVVDEELAGIGQFEFEDWLVDKPGSLE